MVSQRRKARKEKAGEKVSLFPLFVFLCVPLRLCVFARHFYRTLAKVTETGAPTSKTSPVAVKPPVFGSMRKMTMLSESWLAARRNAPDGSMAKLRGVLP